MQFFNRKKFEYRNVTAIIERASSTRLPIEICRPDSLCITLVDYRFKDPTVIRFLLEIKDIDKNGSLWYPLKRHYKELIDYGNNSNK